MTLTFEPLTSDRWDDLSALFETSGQTRGCWCMWWRMRAKDFEVSDRADLKKAFRTRVKTGPPPGLLAYDGATPVGWVQAGPRAEIPRFNNGRTSKPQPDADLERTWALSCFFTARSHRRQGLMTALAKAACAHASAAGATAVEAAAMASRDKLQWGEGYVGIVPALERAGFEAVEQRSPIRVLMRWTPDGA